ncbi:MAG: hypothetical protein WCK59_02900 [Candidatus Falkowbacteria bacterium]
MKKKVKRPELKDLFCDQINQLLKLGYPSEIISRFKSKETDLLDVCENLDFLEEQTPFMPVVPEKVLAYRDQASLVSKMPYLKNTLDVRGWRHHLLEKLQNTYIPNFSSQPYYLVGVVIAEEPELNGLLKINHEEGFAITALKPELLKHQRMLAATACDWEGDETAVIHLTVLEAGFNEYYIAADWRTAKRCQNLSYGFCQSRLI